MREVVADPPRQRFEFESLELRQSLVLVHNKRLARRKKLSFREGWCYERAYRRKGHGGLLPYVHGPTSKDQ